MTAGRMIALLTALIVATTLLTGALILGTGGTSSVCGATAATPATAAAHPAVDGYAGEQLTNAAAIMNAATALDLPAAAETIGVMTAMGESGLRILDHGDAAGPDSRGLFQQRANWGPLPTRLDPTSSATLFYRHLAATPGWATMAPTAAAHAVQGNADPGYYTPFYAAAQAVVAALTSGDAACAAEVSADPQALAQKLVVAIDAGRIVGTIPDHLREIRWIAEGRTVPNCGVDTRILQVISIALATFGKIGVSDINRRCTGQIEGAGIESPHWINGGGHAIDFYSLGGTPTTGADPDAIKLIDVLDPVMPPGARIGQANCRTAAGTTPPLTHLRAFDDTCTHLHIDAAYATGALLATSPTTTGIPATTIDSGTGGQTGGSTAPTYQPPVTTTGLRAIAEAAGAGQQIALEGGTYSVTDFRPADAVTLPTGAGITGTGTATTVLEMTPHTSTHANDVPHQPYTTNQLSLLKVHDGSPTLTGFTLQGTDQDHLYNGLRLANTHNATIRNVTVAAIPGDSSYPPGETFGINDFHTTDTTYNGVLVNGSGVGAAGLGFNDSTSPTVTDSTFTNNPHSAGITAWETSGHITYDHITSTHNHSGFNFERVAGTVVIDHPVLAGNGTDIRINSDQGSADVTIIDPVHTGPKLTIAVTNHYRGVPNTQRRGDIRVIIDGVDRTDQVVHWTG